MFSNDTLVKLYRGGVPIVPIATVSCDTSIAMSPLLPMSVSATALFDGDKILSLGLTVSYIPPKVAIPIVAIPIDANPTVALFVSRLP